MTRGCAKWASYGSWNALYGLRESPKCWGDNRDAELRAIRIIYEGSPTRFTQSRTDPNMWKIVKMPTNVLRLKVPVCIRVRIAAFIEPVTVGLMLTYVDDLLAASKAELLRQIKKTIREIWKCGDVSSSLDKQDILFLSSRIVKTSDWIQLDQQPYALDLIDSNGLIEANSTRVAIAADQGMQGQVSESHEEEVDSLMSETVRQAQRMAGELLWLSQRTRPDLPYAANVACSTALNDPLRR